MTKKAANQHGFTFIELIIAVTIFAIIAVSIYSTFRAGIKIWLKTSPMIEENQALRMFFSSISSDIKRAVAYYEDKQALTKSVFGSAYEGKINFEGTHTRISFMSVINISDTELGTLEEPARITYIYDKNEKTLRRLVATKAEGLNEENARSARILSGVGEKDFGFEYCYKKPVSNIDYEYEWKDAWEEKNVLKIPRGVRVTVGPFRKTIFVPTGTLGEEE
jgi:prepilin-type N-terminal cleavage/methylation domain-containing protein